MTRQKDKGNRKKAGGRTVAFSFCLFPFALCLVSGCHSCDTVETELRHRETELRETREALDQCRLENEFLHKQLGIPHEAAHPPGLPEQIAQATTLKEISLGRMTGGYDVDHCPGDEALQVILEPHDCDGHAIKTPGALKVGVLEITSEGIKKPLSWWDVTPEQLRRSWKAGLLGNGYYLVLPWNSWPTTEKLRVVAQLTTEDGRVFEADKDIKIRLVAKPEPKPAVAVPPPDGEQAPPPHPLEGPSLSKRSSPSQPVQHQAARVNGADPWWHVEKPAVKPLLEAVHILRPRADEGPIPVLGPPTASEPK